MSGVGAHRNTLIVAVAALAARLGVAIWAAGRFPPTADGSFYHTIATRIGAGVGYTWLWPDGAVTYAAHYPVGYPGLIGFGYALFGATPVVAMLVNAVFGALAAVAAHQLAVEATSSRRALLVGLLVAFHVALVPYTAALMTEGVAASLWTLAVGGHDVRAQGEGAAPRVVARFSRRCSRCLVRW